MIHLGSTLARVKLKGIDGKLHKWWSMWFNSTLRDEPYPDWFVFWLIKKLAGLNGQTAGAAWLSSARAVRCLVKSSNERNPYA